VTVDTAAAVNNFPAPARPDKSHKDPLGVVFANGTGPTDSAAELVV
jgi:hypothetical protein